MARLLSIGDSLYLLKQRRVWWLPQESNRQELNDALAPVTDEERAQLEERRNFYIDLFPGTSIRDLQSELRELGISSSTTGVANLAEALEAASHKGKRKEPQLDREQQAVLNNWEKERLSINGGPGSGKTVTLAAFVQHVLSQRPQARVLVLSLDPHSKRDISTRLQKRGVKLLQKSKALNSECPSGCLVTTFASLGFWATETSENLMASDEGRCLRQSLGMLRLLPLGHAARCWDWIVVDDAQDVSRAHGAIVEFLRGESTHLVLAGSVCLATHQEEGAWFTSILEQTTQDVDLFLLHNNYRSSPRIVELLNVYASAHFPTLHFDQIPSRQGPVDSTVKILPALFTQRCAQLVRERLELSDLKDAMAVSPVTVNACNEQLTEQVLMSESKRRPRSHCLVFSTSCSSAVTLSDLQSYVIATSRGVRGAERRRVVVYGVTETFANHGVSRSLYARLLYVAMSRAQDHLHVIAGPALPGPHPLSCIAGQQSPSSPLVRIRRLAREPYRYLSGRRALPNQASAEETQLPIPLVRSKLYAGAVDGARLGGAKEEVTNLPRKEFLRLARAKLALQSAAHLQNSVDRAYGRMSLPPNISNSICIISVDFECTLGDSNITEIGAVAFMLDGRVVGAYQHVLPGVSVLTEYDDERDDSDDDDDDEAESSSDSVLERDEARAADGEGDDSDDDDDDEAESSSDSVLERDEARAADGEENEDQTDDESAGLEAAGNDILRTEATRVCREILRQCRQAADPVSSLAVETSDGREAETRSAPDLEKMTGLRVTDAELLTQRQRRAVRRFHRWARHVSADGRCFLHWSGSEPRVLDLDRLGQSYDGLKLFSGWLEAEDMARPTGRSLTDCVRQVLGPAFPFQPHRAYEDALATAAVFLAMIRTAG